MDTFKDFLTHSLYSLFLTWLTYEDILPIYFYKVYLYLKEFSNSLEPFFPKIFLEPLRYLFTIFLVNLDRTNICKCSKKLLDTCCKTISLLTPCITQKMMSAFMFCLKFELRLIWFLLLSMFSFKL